MKKQTKLTLIALLVVLTLTCVVGLVACDQKGAEEAIKMYILPQAETLVSADFTLPKAIGADNSVQVKWTSDNTAAIAIEDAGEAYTAKVTIQDQITDVKLTISAGKHSKDFTVRVDGFSVYTFSDHFPFAQKNGAVKKDFDLETSYTYQGKTATITWSIDSQYEQYIQLNAEKTKVIVTQPEDITPVAINAEFSYNNESAPVTYNFSVVPPFEHRQEIARMYSVADYPVEISGYVVHIYENTESYNNATFYVIDDDFCSGYYMFRCTDATTDQHLNKQKLTEGCHVTISGATAKDYNGLWENNSNGTFVVDDDKTPINPRDHIYPLDTDLLSGVQSCIWHESTLVSLSGWKLAEKYTKPTGSDSNMFKLEKNGLQITVRISKYINRTDAELAELLAVYDQFEVGQYVNVVGILGYYNAFQIQPILASDITKADAEVANTDGAKVKAAIAAVDAKVKEHFSTTIVADTTVSDMPTEVDGVAVSYRLAGDGLQDITVTVDGGKIEVKPNASYKNYDIEVTYSIGDYKGYSFFKLPNQKLDDQGIVDTVKAAIESKTLPEVKATGDVDLPSVDAMGAVIRWSIENKPDWVTIDDSKITVNALPAESTTLTVVATISLNGKEATAKLTLSVSAAATEVFQAIEAPAAGEYKFAQYVKQLSTWYYATDAMAGFYLGTTENYAEAATYTISAGENDTWVIKVGSKFFVGGPRINDDGTENTGSGNVYLQDQLGDYPWKWDSEIKAFYVEFGGTKWYCGNYDDRTSIALSKASYMQGASNFYAKFGTMVSGGTTPGGTTPGGTTPGGDTETKYGIKAATEFKANTDYYLGLYNTQKSTWYFFTGVMGGYNDYYYATSDNKDDAAIVVLEAHDGGGYYIKVKSSGKYLTLGPRNGTTYSSSSLSITETATTVWTYDETINCFTTELENNGQTYKFYLGNYDKNTDFAGLQRFEDGNYAGVFGEIVPTTEIGGGETNPGGSTSGGTTPSDKPTLPTNPSTDGATHISLSVADIATANNWENGSQYLSLPTGDSKVTIEASYKTYNQQFGANTGKYYNKGTNWRIYQNEEPSITISVAGGSKLVGFKITYESQNGGTLMLGDAEVASGTVYGIPAGAESALALAVTSATANNGQVRITAIELWYAAA